MFSKFRLGRLGIAHALAPAALVATLYAAGITPWKIPPPPRTTHQSAVQVPQYEAVDLGMPEGAVQVKAQAASPNFRYIAGYVHTRTVIRAFVWHDGKFHYLPSDGLHSFAWAANDSGTVAGDVWSDEYHYSAVVWSDGKVRHLFPAQGNSTARAIDNKGNIYGDRSSEQRQRVYLVKPNGSATDLDTYPKHLSYFQTANGKKQVACIVSPSDSIDNKDQKRLVWSKNKLHELPSLTKGGQCWLRAMNDKGTIAGVAYTAGHDPMPAIWKNYKLKLAATPKIRSGWAMGINNHDDVVGEVVLPKGYLATPFLVYDGTFYYLDDLLVRKERTYHPLKISDTGIILAEARVGNSMHAFLLKPVPDKR